MPKPNITLFTSIPPKMKRVVQGRDFGEQWQAACVKSWSDAGFRVVSLNAPGEIEFLRQSTPSVEFRELSGDGVRPRIVDFFEAAKTSESDVVGIINADCLIIPQIGIAERLARGVDGVVIAERLNLSNQTFQPTGVSCFGFDAFFFNVSTISSLERDDHWRIGEVWVDFWLPLVFYVAGFKIETMPAPVLLHLNHDIAWDPKLCETHFPKLVDLVRRHGGLRSHSRLGDELLRERVLDTQETMVLSRQLFDWLSSREPFWRPEPATLDDFLVNVLVGLATPKQSALAGLQGQVRRLIDTLGLRRTLHALGIVSRRVSL